MKCYCKCRKSLQSKSRKSKTTCIVSEPNILPVLDTSSDVSV